MSLLHSMNAERLTIGAMLAIALFPAGLWAAPDIPSPPVRGSVGGYHFENDIIASKPNDQGAYLLLGSGFLRATRAGDTKAFVSDWLKSHPNAIVTPISRMLSTNTRNHQLMEFVYIWVEDGANSLNVDLIRGGMFAAGTMHDMVDNERGLERLLKNDPRLAYSRAEIEREKVAAPEDRVERLVSEIDYKARIARVNEAEHSARKRKLGIWSDAMKEEREVDGIE